MRQKILIALLIMTLAGLAAAVIVLHAERPKIAYIDLSKVYADFEMKKEYEKKLTQVQDMRKQQLDSLELDLNIMSRSMQNYEASGNKKNLEAALPEFELLRRQFVQKQQAFEQDNEAMTQQYTEQIWKQINQYVKEYGKEHSYTCVLGGDGSGAVMYTEDANDVTGEVSKYVNMRYKGLSASK